MGPPSSGGVALLEILNILENYSLIFYGPSADTFHLVIEAQKIAFEDRALHLGDPDFVKIPVEKLTPKEYAKKKAKEIKFEEARFEEEPLVEEASRSAKGNTSHISIRDAEGIKGTPSKSTGFGIEWRQISKTQLGWVIFWRRVG